MLLPSLWLLAAYLLGSIPFGLLLPRWFRGVDIRTLGSGNIGATNVARNLGGRWGLAVLVLDALKGALSAGVLPLMLPDTPGWRDHLPIACGLAAILGHMFPCWLKFRGGKGVATALGVVSVVSPWGSLVAAAAFGLTFGLSRIVSLSSLLAALAYAGFNLWQLRPAPFSDEHWSLAAFSLFVPLLIVIRHRTNIARLLSGSESRFRAGTPGQSHGDARST